MRAARITFVECSGAPVRVGLLVAESRTGNYVCSAASESESVFAKRSESFESPRDYREWWYRLQVTLTLTLTLTLCVCERERERERVYGLSGWAGE